MKNNIQDMDWIDFNSIKLMAISVYLSIFSIVMPEGFVGFFAVCASVTTILFNLYKFYDTKNKRGNDGDTKESN